ncbi:hypothetical protein N7466_007717 [Penicillium verhagenii]|uniref:uncharacterized protein n=1 Tax=Penicillium verhagenii TaxID=1562060 RepID=UPI0025450EB7|nr:uncharacterized protein N7466_007717 [Penicillium verhagenii]KAJ5928761.1 hypothetical protein N7466_007717 [Penicillium verhagenii]
MTQKISHGSLHAWDGGGTDPITERSDCKCWGDCDSDFHETDSKANQTWKDTDPLSEGPNCWNQWNGIEHTGCWKDDNEKPTADDDGKKLQEELKSLCTKLGEFWAQKGEEDQSFSQMGAASTGIIESVAPLMEEAKGLCLIASEINFKVNCMMVQRNHRNSMKGHIGDLSFLITSLDKSAVQLDTAARKITTEVLNANAAMVKMNAASFDCSEQ